MARKQGFKVHYKNIGNFLKTQGEEQLRAVAAQITANIPEGQLVRIDEYTTDRKVIGIVVAAHAQAKDGIATKAASAAGMSQGRP